MTAIAPARTHNRWASPLVSTSLTTTAVSSGTARAKILNSSDMTTVRRSAERWPTRCRTCRHTRVGRRPPDRNESSSSKMIATPVYSLENRSIGIRQRPAAGSTNSTAPRRSRSKTTK